MAIKLLTELIDKEDTADLIGAQIVALLQAESANQMALALLELPPRDPDDWKLRVYRERANPWEAFRGPPAPPADTSPIINVWFDVDTEDQGATVPSNKQTMTGTFNIDCYGYGISASDGAGHIPGDQAAALEAHRALKLVRNIIMSSINTYLQLRGTVGRRSMQTRQVFQPLSNSRPIENIVGARLALAVHYIELSPQTVAELITGITYEVTPILEEITP